MKKIVSLLVLFILIGCADEEMPLIQNSESSLSGTLPSEMPTETDNFVTIQAQSSSFNFNEDIQVAYVMVNITQMDIFLLRKRKKSSYSVAMQSRFDSGDPSHSSIQEMKIGTISISNNVGSGVVSFSQPADLYYDSDYYLEARTNSEVLATSELFEIGTPQLTLLTPNHGSTIYEDDTNIISFSSNFDPTTAMIVEMKVGNTVRKRFHFDNIDDDRQAWDVYGRANVGSAGLIGNLSELSLRYMNLEMGFPPTENFSANYSITIYPHGYSGISDTKNNINVVEKKFDAFPLGHIGIVSFNDWGSFIRVKRHAVFGGGASFRWDLYKNGKWHHALNGNSFYVDVQKSLLDGDVNDRWDVRLTSFPDIDLDIVPALWLDMVRID